MYVYAGVSSVLVAVLQLKKKNVLVAVFAVENQPGHLCQ
jgi:hypothetical protein